MWNNWPSSVLFLLFVIQVLFLLFVIHFFLSLLLIFRNFLDHSEYGHGMSDVIVQNVLSTRYILIHCSWLIKPPGPPPKKVIKWGLSKLGLIELEQYGSWASSFEEHVYWSKTLKFPKDFSLLWKFLWSLSNKMSGAQNYWHFYWHDMTSNFLY